MARKSIIPAEFHYSFPYKRIRIFPDRDLRASILELSMIDTRIMQRLRSTKQLGNSNVSYPTAEHSRFSHSLGVLYWAIKILTSLKDNHNASLNSLKLDKLNALLIDYFKIKLPGIDQRIFNCADFLGITWFEQLVRLYALLHDISHIPFGHTIEDQAQLFERHDDDLRRLNFVFNMLKQEVRKSYHFEDIEYSDELSQIAEEYINLVEAMFVVGIITSDPQADDHTREGWLKAWDLIDPNVHLPLLLSYDIVSNTICADLMDYTLRDTLFASMPKTFDKALLTCMKIVEHDTTFYLANKIKTSMFRLGVSISRKKVRHDIITAILDLLRIRYDLTEKVYYHHTKVIIDAMLEKILRSLPKTKELQFTPYEIYEKFLGDEGFLSLLESKLKGNDDLIHVQEILNKMLSRNLYKAVFRINKNEPLSKKGKANQNRCKKPEGRDNLEKQIIDELSQRYDANITEGDIIISYPPEKMQKKVAKALIEWSDGQIFTFENLPLEANYSNEVGILTERYQTLWAMTIYVNPSKISYIRLIESVCENIFDVHNESILKNYLKEKYELYYDSEEVMMEITHKVISKESEFVASKAAKGGSYIERSDRIEIVENAYQQIINANKTTRRSKAKAKPISNDGNDPQLNLQPPKEL